MGARFLASTHSVLDDKRWFSAFSRRGTPPTTSPGRKVAVSGPLSRPDVKIPPGNEHKAEREGVAELTESVDRFCETNNAVVLCDHTSNYKGKYGIPFALVINQASLNKANTPAYTVDILIHIGEVTGEEGAPRMIKSKETWRVSEDGEIRDYFKNMSRLLAR